MGKVNKVFKYGEYLKENLGEEYADNFEEYTNLKTDILNMIQESINSRDMNLIEEFIESYLEDPKSTMIEGLINDSDIFDFYLKYTNEIDEILSDNDFFDNTPLEVGAVGLYNFLTEGTIRCVKIVLEDMKNELF